MLETCLPSQRLSTNSVSNDDPRSHQGHLEDVHSQAQRMVASLLSDCKDASGALIGEEAHSDDEIRIRGLLGGMEGRQRQQRSDQDDREAEKKHACDNTPGLADRSGRVLHSVASQACFACQCHTPFLVLLSCHCSLCVPSLLKILDASGLPSPLQLRPLSLRPQRVRLEPASSIKVDAGEKETQNRHITLQGHILLIGSLCMCTLTKSQSQCMLPNSSGTRSGHTCKSTEWSQQMRFKTKNPRCCRLMLFQPRF